MLIGVPTEIKNNERRVGMTPEAVKEVVAHGHTVHVQSGAGLGIGALDADYQAAGATTVPTAGGLRTSSAWPRIAGTGSLIRRPENLPNR